MAKDLQLSRVITVVIAQEKQTERLTTVKWI